MSHRRVPLRHQLTTTECAAACLAMVASSYGRDTSVAECRDIVGAGRDGVSLGRLAEAAPRLGLTADVVATTDPTQPNPQGGGPRIAYLSRLHFVVIERVTRRGVRLVDPAVGRVKQSREEFLARYGGVVVDLRPGPDFRTRRRRLGHIQILRYLREFVAVPGGRRILAGVVVLAALLKLLGLALPLATQVMVDRLVPAHRLDLLPQFAIAVVGTALLAGAVSIARALALVALRARADTVLGRRFVHHLLRLPLPYFLHRTRGDLLMRLESVSSTREIVTQQVLSLVLDAALLVGYLVGLSIVAPGYVPVVVVLMLVQAAVLLRAYPRIGALAQRELAAKAEEQSYLVETLEAIAPVKANGVESRAEVRWSDLFGTYQQAMVRRSRSTAGVEAIHQGLTTLAPLALLWLGMALVLSGRMTLGTALAANAVALSVLAPVHTLTMVGQLYPTLRGQIERMYDVLDAAEERTGSAFLSAGRPAEVTLNTVAFRYHPNAPLVLSDVSFAVPAGGKVGIVGRTGSGKSTIAMLVLGLVRPERGTVSHDGVNLESLDVHALRAGCGVVLQDLNLFNGSIRDNLTLGRPEATDADVEWAARTAGLHDDIQRLPLRYETFVGESGAALSAGQRQRIALARALVQRPRLLILDEATSHLDPQTERRVDTALSQLEVTRIVISHREGAIRNADQILVLDEGRIVARGRHEDLIQEGGAYQELFAGGAEPVAARMAVLTAATQATRPGPSHHVHNGHGPIE